jgi:diamine N-acetyltransferase
MADTMHERPLVNILGDAVALGPMRRDLMPLYQRWINDFATVRTLGVTAPRPITLEADTAWYDAEAASGVAAFTIYERATWRPIGNTRLRDVDYRNRTATFGILIGESDARGRGYGTEATRLMLDYAFTALGLHNVLLTVASFNAAGQRAYQKAGFREIGRRRECRSLAGKLWDDIYMDCQSSHFASPVLNTIFGADPAPS